MSRKFPAEWRPTRARIILDRAAREWGGENEELKAEIESISLAYEARDRLLRIECGRRIVQEMQAIVGRFKPGAKPSHAAEYRRYRESAAQEALVSLRTILAGDAERAWFEEAVKPE